MDRICEDCGEANPPDAAFCRNCNAFLAWDRTTLTKTSKDRTPPPPGSAAPPSGSPPTAAPISEPPPPAGQDRRPSPDHPPTFTTGGAAAGPPERRPAQPAAARNHAPSTGPGGGTAPTAPACPQCGYGNPETVRFCIRCGYALGPAEVPDWSQQTSAWSARDADRAAKREYRRSLPPLYRWRRVGLGVLAGAVLIGGGLILRVDQGRFYTDAWYWLNKRYETVAVVTAGVDPASAAAAGSDPAKLVDGTAEEFTMNWAPQGTTACGAAPGTGWITLTIKPARIRRVVIYPGLAKDNPQRGQQPRPKAVGLRFDDGACQPFTLSDTDEPIRLTVDSGQPVTRVQLGIAADYPVADSQALISITEIVLKAYPSQS